MKYCIIWTIFYTTYSYYLDYSNCSFIMIFCDKDLHFFVLFYHVINCWMTFRCIVF